MELREAHGGDVKLVNFLIEVFGEIEININLKMFLFKYSWKKESIAREMVRGPRGNPALVRNDPFR